MSLENGTLKRFFKRIFKRIFNAIDLPPGPGLRVAPAIPFVDHYHHLESRTGSALSS